MIDILAPRHFYKRFEITRITYIRKSDNPADCLTKLKESDVLKELFEYGMMTQKPKRWVVWKTVRINTSMEKEGRERISLS